MLSNSHPKLSTSRLLMTDLKVLIENRAQVFVDALRSLGLNYGPLFFFVDEQTQTLIIATLYELHQRHLTVLLTDHDTQTAGIYLSYFRQEQVNYFPLTEPSALEKVVDLAPELGWEIRAKTASASLQN